MSFGMGAGHFSGKAANKFSEEKKVKDINKTIYKRLIRTGKKYWSRFLAGFLLIIVVSVINLIRPYFMKTAIDDYIKGYVNGAVEIERAISGVEKLALIFLLIMAVEFVFKYLHTYILQKTGKKIIMELRQRVFSHIQKLPVSFFDRNPIGRIVTRVTNDTDAINEMFTNVVVGFLQNIFLMAGIVVVMLSLNTNLTLISFTVLPFMVAVSVLFRNKARIIFNEIRTRLAAINAFFSEHISGMKIIQAFNMQEKKLSELEKINKKYYESSLKRTRLFGIFRPFMDVVKSLALALLLWYGGGRIIKGTLEFGTLFAFISYINMFFQPIMELTERYNTLQGALVASDRIFTLLDTKAEPEPVNPVKPEKAGGKVEFKNVWFAYAGERWVLKDVSFVINPGQSAAFVGATGAGKTSIINLMCGFYENQRGEILIDGVNIKDMKKEDYRKNIGLVLQDVFLFSGDIKTNIGLFDKNITLERIKEASDYVNASKYIEKLPKGYLNPVNERGSVLSLGQRQLLSFARALLKNPSILVMDEATSSIDTETEQLIQDAVGKLMEGRTSIAIAHRLSTIQKADRIMVIHKGELVETGNHQELLQKEGLYYNLYRLQYKEELEGA